MLFKEMGRLSKYDKRSNKIIENCGECPYFKQYYDIADCFGVKCLVEGRELDHFNYDKDGHVPEWCPLPDFHKNIF